METDPDGNLLTQGDELASARELLMQAVPPSAGAPVGLPSGREGPACHAGP